MKLSISLRKEFPCNQYELHNDDLAHTSQDYNNTADVDDYIG